MSDIFAFFNHFSVLLYFYLYFCAQFYKNQSFYYKKMSVRIKDLLFAGIVLGGSMLVTSCIDESYDLDNVDMTIGTNVDLTLPVSSTGSIFLKNIMDLKEDGVVQLVWDESRGDSIYCVKQTGSANVPPIHIKKISIRQPELADIDATLNLDTSPKEMSKAPGKRPVKIMIPIPGLGEQEFELPDTSYNYTLKDHEADYTLEATKAQNISSDVVSITHIDCEPAKFSMRLKVSGFPDFIENIRAKNLALTIPGGFEFTDVYFMDQKITNIQDSVIHLSDEVGAKILLSEDVDLELTFVGMQEGKHFKFDGATHSASIDGTFALTGTFELNTEDINSEKLTNAVMGLTEQERQEVMQTRSIAGLLPTSVNFHGHAEFDNDIVVSTFSGDVLHSVGRIDPIKLNDLPDFLNDDDVVLDLDNPLIFISATNGVTADAYTKITLTSIYNNGLPSVIKSTEQLMFSGNGKRTVYYLADHETNAIPAEYAGAKFSRIEDMGELIRKIPEKINVEVEPISMHAENVDIRRDYDVSVDYDVYAPIAFGENFQLVYRDTENGWSEDLGDLEDLTNADGTIELNAKIESNLETQLSLTLIPLDRNGNRIPELEVNSVTVPAKAKGKSINLTIKTKNGHKLSDVLNGVNGVQQLDGITYEARLDKADEDAMLTASNKIRLYDAKITLKAKIAYDAN